jgi:putative cell wall-binding protein
MSGSSGRPASTNTQKEKPLSIRTQRNSKRGVAAVVTAALGVSLLALSTSSPVGATATVNATTRISGDDRYATANAVANTPAITNEDRFVLVSGENFPDGLTASALAGAIDGSILMTPSAAVPNSVLSTLTSMSSTAAGAKNVVIVGGTSAVSAATEAQLTALGFAVSRISGDDRYATANAVAAATRLNNTGGNIGTFGGYRTAFLANGVGFADALAASGWAYEGAHPIFLTNGTTLSDSTKAAITAAGVQQVVVLGGTAAVSASVQSAVTATAGVISVVRVDGADRYETATKLATTLSGANANLLAAAILVSGTNFPDALAASQRAGRGTTNSRAIIPVTSPMPKVVADWFTANQAIGGTTAVPAALVTAAAAAATIAKPTATVAAADGSTTATVTFSAQMTAGNVAGGAEVLASYVRTSSAGAVSNPTGVSYAYNSITKASVATLTFLTALVPGDTISVVANAINHVSNGTTAAGASTVVTADTTAPTATITAISGVTGAGAGSARVWVTLSANTLLSSWADTDLVHVPQVIGATPGTFTCTDIGTLAATRTKSCTIATTALVAGDTVRIAAGSIDSAASTAVKNAVVNASAAADTTAPVLQSVRYSQAGTGGASASLASPAGGGVYSITARSTAAAAGKAGNDWKVIRTVQTGSESAATVSVNSTAKTVTIAAKTSYTAEAVTGVLNTDATFSSLFVATTTTAGLLGGTWTNDPSGTALAGGLDLLTLTLTFSEPLRAAVSGDFTISTTEITGQASQTLVSAAATNDGRLTGVLTVTVQTSGAPLAGVSTVTVANTVLDRAGNAVVTSGTSHIVAMTPAS